MADDERKVFIGGLPFGHKKEDLFEMFEKYGRVEDAFIIMNPETGRSRGFGFVIFETEESLTEAIDGLHETELDGRKLVVEKAGKRRSRGGGYRRGGGGGGGGFRGGYRGEYRNRDYGGSGGDYRRGGDREYSGGRRNYDGHF